MVIGVKNKICVFEAITMRFEQLNQGAMQNIAYMLDEKRNITPSDMKSQGSVNQFMERT
jgi:hypothetical protein